MSNQEMRKKVPSKAAIGKSEEGPFEEFGARLQIPAHIKREIEAEGLVARFVSVKKMAENGGYHPNSWQPYTIKNPVKNPITGQMEEVFRLGDLILAVKTKDQHARHVAFLKQKASSQTQGVKNSIKEMRDRIRDSRADKHISLIEGYEENGEDE